ncbi:MAG: ATPase, T2SS/T4P/T4SS family [Bacteroidota bacterium]|nr:ATPase, T2SS/T4P/T4SS family [Bacteroidota bacterium]
MAAFHFHLVDLRTDRFFVNHQRFLLREVDCICSIKRQSRRDVIRDHCNPVAFESTESLNTAWIHPKNRLHTNDAPAAVSRLYKMGVEPFLIAYAINLVVAQRLIRVVCPDCKVVDEDPDRTLMHGLGWTDEEIDSSTIYKANRSSGCPTCGGNGYKGRRAVCETLYFTSEIRTMVAESAEAIDEDAIRDQAVKDGMLTLADSARVLVDMGETTVEEMLRMTASE